MEGPSEVDLRTHTRTDRQTELRIAACVLYETEVSQLDSCHGERTDNKARPVCPSRARKMKDTKKGMFSMLLRRG